MAEESLGLPPTPQAPASSWHSGSPKRPPTLVPTSEPWGRSTWATTRSGVYLAQNISEIHAMFFHFPLSMTFLHHNQCIFELHLCKRFLRSPFIQAILRVKRVNSKNSSLLNWKTGFPKAAGSHKGAVRRGGTQSKGSESSGGGYSSLSPSPA